MDLRDYLRLRFFKQQRQQIHECRCSYCIKIIIWIHVMYVCAMDTDVQSESRCMGGTHTDNFSLYLDDDDDDDIVVPSFHEFFHDIRTSD